jgi:hypothetical protein
VLPFDKRGQGGEEMHQKLYPIVAAASELKLGHYSSLTLSLHYFASSVAFIHPTAHGAICNPFSNIYLSFSIFGNSQ